jgi:hypothetical protein
MTERTVTIAISNEDGTVEWKTGSEDNWGAERAESPATRAVEDLDDAYRACREWLLSKESDRLPEHGIHGPATVA